MNPKAFISHATDDKKRFVIDFATKLRSHGIDAWLDQWEMLPGDSLVYKIFEEGIKNADVFIIVLSKNSVNKPWVVEELSAGFVKKVSCNCKIIPIVIDECEIPECLKSTLWEPIQDIENYEANLNRIVQSIYGVSEKPALGQPPKFIRAVIDSLPGINQIDTILFNHSCQLAISKDDKSINLSSIHDFLKEKDISDENIIESLGILDSRGFIKVTRAINGHIPFFSISNYGFDLFLRNNISDYDLLEQEVCLKILNDKLMSNFLISEALNMPIIITNHIMESLDGKKLVNITKSLDGRFQIYYISPEFKRIFR